ncbi:flippase [Leptospira montravelensis]|uniref:Flippase n=1 Tax=Leptospira montravelensis TaxID=2484961 RepID=A0ABY2LUQ9_9LEPT|nr:flippase [Leptospira montravelensis]TGK83451.1 flippase [Leptospira montravelensis]TGL05453.1 flippase [Leptospira montravelensis]
MKVIVYNFLWMFGDRIFKMLLALFVGVWIVRYFGPAYYGKFNYVTAWLSIFSILIPLGTESILVSEFVKYESERDSLLASGFLMYLISSIFFSLLALVFIYFARSDDYESLSICLVLLIPNFLRSFTIPKYYFESVLKVKKIVIIENSYLILFSVIKILFLYFKVKPIIFIWMFALEGIFISLTIFIYYNLSHSLFRIAGYSILRIKDLIRKSFPLLLANLSVIAYMKMDQIMVGNLVGDRNLGIYSVAVRISEMWYFIPMAIASSFYPMLIKTFADNSVKYYKILQTLHCYLFLLSLCLAIFIHFFGTTIVHILYGEQFRMSAEILKVHIWTGVFVFLGVAGSNDLIIRELQKHSLYKSLFGLTINLILNWLLIPGYGIFGAAIATLISQVASSTLYYLIPSDTRVLFNIQFNCLKIWKYPAMLRVS